MMNREMNKPFTLTIVIPHDAEMTAVFSPCTVETAVFPVDRDNDLLHTFIVNKITDMTADAMKPFFEVSSEIREALQRLVHEHYKRDATGEGYFQFLTSQRPNNSNVALSFGAACQQCLRSDSPSGPFIWAYPPEEFVRHISNLVCFTLEDRPDNEFFDKASSFLPANIRGAFKLYKQSSIVEKRPFSNTLFQGMDDKWHSSVTIAMTGNPVNLVTVQDSGSRSPSDDSQVPNRVSMDSNQGAKDSSQDSKHTELDGHARQLSPTAGWGHVGFGPLNSVQPDLNSTPTAGNTSHSIRFSIGSEDNSPPSDTTAGNDPSFPSMTHDISSIGNANHGITEPNPSDAHEAHEVRTHHVSATDKTDDVSSIDNRSRISAHSLVHSLAATMKQSLLRPFQHRQGSATTSSVYSRINSVLRGDIPRNPPSQVSFAQPNIVHHFDPYGTPNASAAPTADTAYVPEYHTPHMAFKSANVDMLTSDIARNGHPTDPFSHTPPHVP